MVYGLLSAQKSKFCQPLNLYNNVISVEPQFSCDELPLLMLISSMTMSHELVEADLERVNRTGGHN